MKVSSMLVISVTSNLHCKVVLIDTLDQNMMVSGIFVTSVTPNIYLEVTSIDT